MEKEQEKDLVSMTISSAAHILRVYNEYRRGDHEPCDPPFTAKAIGEAIDIEDDMLERNAIRKVDIDNIIRAVSRETGVTEQEMCRKGRQREFAEARAIVSFLSYTYTSMTLTAIGHRLNRDHATTIHYNRTVQAWLDEPRRNLRGARIVTKLMEELDNA